MAKRLIAVVDSGPADGPYTGRARVYRDTEWDEYRVRYYQGEDGLVHYLGEESDSFHSDQADAIGTAELTVKRLAAGVGRERLDNPPPAPAPEPPGLPPARKSAAQKRAEQALRQQYGRRR